MTRVFRDKDEIIKALKMRDEQGLSSYKQISEATGIPTSTLKIEGKQRQTREGMPSG